MMSQFKKIAVLGFILLTSAIHATTCPDLVNSSLAWGEVPAPWEVSPFSDEPQAEEGASFVRATILSAGIPRGIACTYKNSLGEYTIWWQTHVKRPPRTDNQWYEVQGGYACALSLDECEFFPGG